MSTRLGANPLTSPIFKKTDQEQKPESIFPDSGIHKMENVNQHPASGKEVFYDKITVRLPSEINDWLDETIRQTKRINGFKIKKELFVQAALEMIKEKDIDWSQIRGEEDFKKAIR